MAGQLKLRRGTTSQLANYIGSEGELTYDTTGKQLRVHDGSTVGGLPTTDDYLAFMPIPYPKSTPPSGYLVMMGQAISQATYPKLYVLYGANLPDMRAYSIRGLDYGRGIDVGRVVLSEQQDDIKSHSHSYSDYRYPAPSNTLFSGSGGQWTGEVAETTGATGGAETRIKNIAFLYIVKAG